MSRRTKQEMESMRNFVKLDLLANKNDPHKAFESMIKEYLEDGKQIPHYIKGIKDYIKMSESEEMQYLFNRKKKEDESNNNRIKVENDIKSMSIETMKTIYRTYKDKVSHYHKLNLHDVYMMIYHNDFHGFSDEHINTFTENKISIN